MKKKKKSKVYFFIPVIIIIIFLCYMFFDAKSKSPFEDVIGAKLDSVDKIDLCYSSDDKSKTITDKDEIKEFVAMFKDVELVKSRTEGLGKGLFLDATFYQGDKELSKFTFGTTKVVIYKDNKPMYYRSTFNFDTSIIQKLKEKYEL